MGDLWVFTVDYICFPVYFKRLAYYISFSYVVLTTYSRRALPESVVFLVLGRQVWFLLIFCPSCIIGMLSLF